jgi:hypothetical protein
MFFCYKVNAIHKASKSYVMCGLKDQLVRLKDEDNAGHQAKGASGSQQVARVAQEKVAKNHHLREFCQF